MWGGGAGVVFVPSDYPHDILTLAKGDLIIRVLRAKLVKIPEQRERFPASRSANVNRESCG